MNNFLPFNNFKIFSTTLKPLIRNLIEPVPAETREILRNTNKNLKKEFHTRIQYLGLQYAGCGATIGTMPRCDFACRGCYLNDTANTTPAESIEGVKQQLRVIREWLGEGGNAQITDGEVTLLPIKDLLEIVRYAREIGLVPMLMTHGDNFKKSPELLHRLVNEAGLSEVSIHIDTTQRGRKGKQYKYATSEQVLTPLRDEFAEMIRTVRRKTGKPLEAATTVTVTQKNIEQIPEIIHWVNNNADAFKMVSFQPLAQVGRTDKKLNGISTTENLWNQIGIGLNSEFNANDNLNNHLGHFGHPDCTNFLQGLVLKENNKPAKFHPLFRSDDTQALDLLKQFSDQFGGVSFRLGSKWDKFSRILGLLLKNPKFIIISVLPFAWQNFSNLHSRGPMNLLLLLIRNKAKISYLNIVSHHFMSRQEIETSLGQERIDACVFKVPINGNLTSMCEVNALGIREKYYASLTKADSSSRGS